MTGLAALLGAWRRAAMEWLSGDGWSPPPDHDEPGALEDDEVMHWAPGLYSSDRRVACGEPAPVTVTPVLADATCPDCRERAGLRS